VEAGRRRRRGARRTGSSRADGANASIRHRGRRRRERRGERDAVRGRFVSPDPVEAGRYYHHASFHRRETLQLSGGPAILLWIHPTRQATGGPLQDQLCYMVSSPRSEFPTQADPSSLTPLKGKRASAQPPILGPHKHTTPTRQKCCAFYSSSSPVRYISRRRPCSLPRRCTPSTLFKSPSDGTC